MSEDATIEDDIEAEQQSATTGPQTNTGLLPWSYIFEIATKNWVIFLVISIAIAMYLYVNALQRRNKKQTSSTIRRDHIQGGASRKSPKRD